MTSGKNQQHLPCRNQHLGFWEVADAFLLHLSDMTHQRLDILGPVFIASRTGELLQPVFQRLLQGATATT